MSYYQGDYYRGGFFSFLGKAAKSLVSFIPGVGPAASTAIGAIEHVTKGSMSHVLQRGGAAAAGAAKIISKHPVLSAAAAAGAVGTGASLLRHPGGARLCAAGGVNAGCRLSG